MFSSFQKARDLFRLQREAKKVKKELRTIHVEAESKGVEVVVSGEQEILSIKIADTLPREDLPLVLKDCLNRALKKAQVVSAEKMQGVMGELGLPTQGG